MFGGPSLGGYSPPAGIDVLPPASRGALTAAVRAGYSRIGVIDGAIEHDTRLPLRELRQTLAMPNVKVFGGASMGAGRAVQLGSAGLRGVGRVYRLFRRGSLTDSDEIFVLHAPAALRYRCLTLALVNVRYTLRAMRRSVQLGREDEAALISYLRGIPWYDRDRRALCAAVYAVFGSSRCARVMQAFDRLYRDVKREDALVVISMLQNHCSNHERRAASAPMGIRTGAVERS